MIIGPGDDAGVFRYGDTLMVETVDVITPIVDDPYTFGAICAANSVSDVFAMGGRPLTALAIIGFATCDYGPPVIRRLLKGAVEKLEEAGACLIGGHSIEDDEFKCGFAVSGVVDKDSLLPQAGARPGDILVLTKKIGTGILTSAVKLGKLKKSALKPAIDSMLTLNKTASKAATAAGAHAATDITGFGLLGHALNIATASKVELVIDFSSVPFMKGVRKFIESGIVQKGARNSLNYVSAKVNFPDSLDEADRMSLVDPQTSGGLLISLPEKGLSRFSRIMRRNDAPFWVIGQVRKGHGGITVK
jgi:selenide,water dikinase